ncbi:MAG: DNA primase [Pseudomonadota bacterium]
MSLPDGFLDELRTRLSLTQVVGRKVMWDTRKSNQGKGDMWAPCPFHQEKTASFHVDDRKGYYYCFGCHAKGDAITFVRETENVSFMEAVEILAGEAGMQMPARDPQAQAKADKRSQLAGVMEQAVQHYRLQLNTGAGAAARDYLSGQRGLAPAAWERWEIGFAPEGWQGLWDHLRGLGVAEDLILGAGLAKPSNSGKQPYDTFRNRIMFPIRDARGRAIAFGGRAMDPADNAKYLNSPETELFDKGRSLYNHGPAREAAGKGQPLIVAEGYMDVIALAEAGFGATVAPLGTAITEDQLRLLWRIAPEPVIALDGDTAGLRAAMRVIDIALPMLEAGQSLRFALMPEGMDPDDLLRAEGQGAMQARIEAAVPMVELLWRRETEGKVFDSPERRAALDNALRAAIGKIGDQSLRRHYGTAINERRRALFTPAAHARAGGRSWGSPKGPPVLAATKSSLLAAAHGAVEDVLREAVILATLVTHPTLVERFESALETLDLSLPEHEAVRDALLAHTTTEAIEGAAGTEALEKLFAPRHVRISPGIRHRDDRELAATCIAEELAKLAARRGAAREIAEAERDLSDLADEGLTWRLSQAADAVARAGRGQAEDKTEYEIAPNGVRISREEKGAFDEILRQLGTESEGPRE